MQLRIPVLIMGILVPEASHQDLPETLMLLWSRLVCQMHGSQHHHLQPYGKILIVLCRVGVELPHVLPPEVRTCRGQEMCLALFFFGYPAIFLAKHKP